MARKPGWVLTYASRVSMQTLKSPPTSCLFSEASRAKSKTKAALKHSTLKAVMTTSFCETQLYSALRKETLPPLLAQGRPLRKCVF